MKSFKFRSLAFWQRAGVITNNHTVLSVVDGLAVAVVIIIISIDKNNENLDLTWRSAFETECHTKAGSDTKFADAAFTNCQNRLLERPGLSVRAKQAGKC